jgi:hypothetical protein
MGECNQLSFELPGFNGRKLRTTSKAGMSSATVGWWCCDRSIAGIFKPDDLPAFRIGAGNRTTIRHYSTEL